MQSSDVTELFYGYDVDTDGDGHSDSIDCDDTDATIHPGAAELCDGVDQDCDGTADEGVTTTFFADADGDGYGRADKSLESCASAVTGYVEQDGDCDDGDASVSPAGTESCDGVDNNCDGDTDEDGAVGSFTVYIDADADGYGGLDSREVCAAPAAPPAPPPTVTTTRPASHPGPASAATPSTTTAMATPMRPGPWGRCSGIWTPTTTARATRPAPSAPAPHPPVMSPTP
ncbi:MAG: putative metal-binding motif-containing protein [Deltaproteobacteria bacterium]|nr:putative metal-binding motif-containing protein [Deltaproteobacteria bacterium]